MTINYTKMITDAKTAARDILRSAKVSDLLMFIRNQEAIITGYKTERETIVKLHEEAINNTRKDIAKSEYRLRIAETTNHPDLEDIKKSETQLIEKLNKSIESGIENHNAELARFDKVAEESTKLVNEKIEEYKTKIEAWNNGESKVCYAEMKNMAEKLVETRITNLFLSGEYDSE